jgi:hypothetical protein
MVPLARLAPATINGIIYKPVSLDDHAVRAMASRLRETVDTFGIGAIDPLVVTLDDTIVSGHRRRAALTLLGVTEVPVKRLPIWSTDPGFEKVLVNYNDQRDKDPAERVREELVRTNPDDAYRELLSHRAEKSKVRVAPLHLADRRKRHKISKAKRPFLDACLRVLGELEDYWPVSDRKVHYELLNDPPLIHASKPDSRYVNDRNSYKRLTDLLTCARLEGLVPWEAIGDETRPVTVWTVHPNVGPFVESEVSGFLTGYYRDLMVGQPNHVEIVGEKMTIESTIRPVAADFCIPYTIGRGYSSLPPRKDIFERYRASGKDELVLLFLSDHDPEGSDIPESFSKSMRDDFGVRRIHAVRVGLTAEQVAALALPPNSEAKTGSSRFKKFADRYGPFAYELEAAKASNIRRWLRDAITAVIDVDVFNQQVEQEKRDAATVAAYRKTAIEYLRRIQAT